MAAATIRTMDDRELQSYLASKFGPDSYGLKVYGEQVRKAAADIRQVDRQANEGLTSLLRDARRLYEQLGYGSLRGLHLRLAGSAIDADRLRGLDDVAERMASLHPEYFAGVADKEQRLFELLCQGNPKPMTKDQAAQQARECGSPGPECWPTGAAGTATFTPAEGTPDKPARPFDLSGMDLTPYIQRWQAGERIGKLAREVGCAWQTLDNLVKRAVLSRN